MMNGKSTVLDHLIHKEIKKEKNEKEKESYKSFHVG